MIGIDWLGLPWLRIHEEDLRSFSSQLSEIPRMLGYDGKGKSTHVHSICYYLLDLFLLHPKELTNSTHESTCSFNLEILEVSNIESGSWPMFTSWMGSSWELHHPLTLWFQGPWPTFLGRISYTSMACFMEEIHLFFFCILRICHWNQAHQCTIYIHLPPFTSNPLTSTDQGPDGTPNIPKPKLQREAAIGFHLVTINMYKQPLHISFSLRLTSDLVAPGISGMVSTCHNVQDRLHGTTSWRWSETATHWLKHVKTSMNCPK